MRARSSRRGAPSSRSRSATTGMPAARAIRAARIMPGIPTWSTRSTRAARITFCAGRSGSAPTTSCSSKSLRLGVHEDRGVERPGPRAPHEMPDRHSLGLEGFYDEPGELVVPQRPRVVTGPSHAASGHQRGARQAAGTPLPPPDGPFRVGPGELVEEEDVVHRDGAQAKDVQCGAHAGCIPMRRRGDSKRISRATASAEVVSY